MATDAKILVGDMCQDANDNLYILNMSTGLTQKIRKIDASTGTISNIPFVKNAESDVLTRICVDQNGVLYYLCSLKEKVVRITSPTKSEIVVMKGPGWTPRAMRDAAPAATSDMQIDKMDILQTADGRLFLETLSDQVQTIPDQAIMQYKTFFVASPGGE